MKYVWMALIGLGTALLVVAVENRVDIPLVSPTLPKA